jgi:hypothetical protein
VAGTAPEAHCSPSEKNEVRYYMKDVFVIGAGMAGISCALALVRHGVSAVVLDRCSRTRWSKHVKVAASQMSDATSLEELLDIRFEFQVDRVSRIDGSNVLVAWSGDSPVIARRGVLAVGATGGEVLVPLLLQSGCGPADMRSGHSGVPDLFVCGELAIPDCGPVVAWNHGREVASLLTPSSMACAA